MIDAFEQQAKPTFKDDRDRSYLKFGSMRDKDLDHGIRSGQLTLEGYATLDLTDLQDADPIQC